MKIALNIVDSYEEILRCEKLSQLYQVILKYSKMLVHLGDVVFSSTTATNLGLGERQFLILKIIIFL